MGRGSNIRSHQVAGGEEDPLGPNVLYVTLNMRPSIVCVCYDFGRGPNIL